MCSLVAVSPQSVFQDLDLVGLDLEHFVFSSRVSRISLEVECRPKTATDYGTRYIFWHQSINSQSVGCKELREIDVGGTFHM